MEGRRAEAILTKRTTHPLNKQLLGALKIFEAKGVRTSVGHLMVAAAVIGHQVVFNSVFNGVLIME